MAFEDRSRMVRFPPLDPGLGVHASRIGPCMVPVEREVEPSVTANGELQETRVVVIEHAQHDWRGNVCTRCGADRG